jgi:hypothetical protein
LTKVGAFCIFNPNKEEEFIMPSMVGGSSTHPAYKPRKMGEHECLMDDRHYYVSKEGGEYVVRWEDPDGASGVAQDDFSPGIPGKLKRYIEDEKRKAAQAPKKKKKVGA